MMSNSLKSKIIGIFIIVFAFGIPAFVTFSTYVTMEETTQKMSANIIGVFLFTAIFTGLIRWLKKRARTKIDSNLHVSPYYMTFLNNTFSLILVGGFTWFIYTIQSEIDVFLKLMIVVVACEIVAYGLKFWQTHFDILIKKETDN
jgi:Ca2+/Na+ antiporter